VNQIASPEETIKPRLVTIDGMAHRGFGVGRSDGLVCFIPFAAKQDELEIQITKQKKSFAFAQIHAIKTPSPDRVSPFCPHFETCGGCQFQHVSYATEVNYKKDILANQLSRNLPKITLPEIQVYAADGENHLNYRHKGTFHYSPGDEPLLGFYGRKSNDVIALTECQILAPALQHIVLHPFFKHLGLLLQKTFPAITAVTLRKFDEGIHCHLLLSAQKNYPNPTSQSVGSDLSDVFQDLGITSCSFAHDAHVANQQKTKADQVLWGEPNFETTVGLWKYQLTPTSFFQNHLAQAEKLIRVINEFVTDTDRRVLDAYCGVGFLSIPLHQRCAAILGFDSDHQAIACAAENARRVGAANCKYIAIQDETAFRHKQLIGFAPDTIILDPPRSGASASLLQFILHHRVKKVISVSCSPPTLVRDLKMLVQGGYHLQDLRMIDMFPHTYHIESASLLTI
jgi:23S rRNA (uracil-5-)-methyltransferase RumA